MNLVEALSSLPRGQVIISGSLNHRTVGQLLESAERISGRLRNRRVAIILDDPVEGIELLIAADGQAESITLLPTHLPEKDVQELLGKANCEILIGDHGKGTAFHGLSEVYSNVRDLREGSENVRSSSISATAWHIVTSGTTGTPKMVAHTLSSLSRTTKQFSDSARQARWGLLYDYTRFAGLQVVLQALISGAVLITPPRNQLLSERIGTLASHGCTHLSATPTLWRTIVMTPGASELTLRQITLGGEIADSRILSTLKEIYPSARVVHIYASTEAGVGFSVRDGNAGFPSTYLDSPPAGVALRIAEGRLQIKSPYTKQRYVGINEPLMDGDGWIDTGDNVEKIGNRIFFLGRANGVLNVGGNKVHPEEVERLLLTLPEVHAVKVYGKTSSIMGTLVVADIVPADQSQDLSTLPTRIREHLQKHAERFKIPAIINFVDQINLTFSGKITRKVSE